jgi:hypothetical protein
MGGTRTEFQPSFHMAVLCGLLDSEDEGTMVLLNVRKYSPIGTISHRRGLECSYKEINSKTLSTN